jgi:hypothetical protein
LRIIAIEAAKKPGKAGRGKFFLHSGCRPPAAIHRKQVCANHPPVMLNPSPKPKEEWREEFDPIPRGLAVATGAVIAGLLAARAWRQ